MFRKLSVKVQVSNKGFDPIVTPSTDANLPERRIRSPTLVESRSFCRHTDLGSKVNHKRERNSVK